MTLNLRTFVDQAAAPHPTARQPVLFIGHGSPMNIVLDNGFTRHLRELGERTPRPAAVLVISAHWLTPGEVRVAVNPRPRTLHDFGGFPEELYRIHYPAPGAPDLARVAASAVSSLKVHEDHEMGLDHGAWSLLTHLWPRADVPVFQMSIDYDKPPEFHLALGRELRGLRDRGILVLGSGNIVHNLRRLRGDESFSGAYDWAVEFDAWSREKLLAGDHDALCAYLHHPAGRLAVPTPDHYLPMMAPLGLLHPGEGIQFTYEQFQNGSISMRSFQSAS